MAFNEDQSRIRQGYAAQNMAVLHHISLNLLTSDKDNKVGIKIKQQMAGWDNNYLLKLLTLFLLGQFFEQIIKRKHFSFFDTCHPMGDKVLCTVKLL